MRPRRAGASAHAGFTLLELVLVMVILLIATAIVVPAFQGFGRGRETKDCASQLVALTRWARTQSITRGTTYRLNLDATAKTYWLTEGNPDGSDAELGEEVGRSFSFPESLTPDWTLPVKDDGGDYIEFRPTGRTDPGTIRLTDAHGQVTAIGCASATELYHVLTPEEMTAR